ncbi:hypothetical protein AGMMS49991_05620 [Spirochaetia bacterium]|nr:hypothetical protein AGMMS49991_05620 [Spirochaetia bacterium]
MKKIIFAVLILATGTATLFADDYKRISSGGYTFEIDIRDGYYFARSNVTTKDSALEYCHNYPGMTYIEPNTYTSAMVDALGKYVNSRWTIEAFDLYAFWVNEVGADRNNDAYWVVVWVRDEDVNITYWVYY